MGQSVTEKTLDRWLRDPKPAAEPKKPEPLKHDFLKPRQQHYIPPMGPVTCAILLALILGLGACSPCIASRDGLCSVLMKS
jgi:hypothetical protein